MEADYCACGGDALSIRRGHSANCFVAGRGCGDWHRIVGGNIATAAGRDVFSTG